jgi:RNA recognition motif-containing protein
MINTVCIEGLPLLVTDNDLRNSCEQWGSVVRLRIVKDANGLSMGYAFVEMATWQDAENLLMHVNQSGLFQRRLFVARTYPVCNNGSIASTRTEC